MVDLSIIIPSYNTKEMTLRCLKSLTSLKTETEIIVVDNGSTDGTVKELKNSTQKLKVIENDKNLGFAKAINQGLKMAQGKYILLLNSDTIVENGTIEKTMELLKNDPQAGVAGCQLRNSDGSIQASGGYLPNLLNLAAWALFLDDLPLIKQIFPAYHLEDKNFYSQKSSAYTKKHNLGWVTGAFFLTKREVVDKVGLFDEKMFMYVEEIDWCQRVRDAGFKVIFNPAGFITHYKGASAKKNKAGLPAEVLAKAGIIEEFQGLKYFFQKHKPFRQYPILRMMLKIGALARILLFGIILQDKKAGQIYEKAFKLA